MRESVIGLIALILALVVIYGLYWVFKTVSYELFYEDMVIETIKEYIKNNNIKLKEPWN